MGIFTKLFKRKDESQQLEVCPEEALLPLPGVRYEEIPGDLDLGWHYSENKDELQMAKIAEEDRATHLYVIGATGTGKTKFLEFLIAQDIGRGRGFGVIDPHGDLIEDIKGLMAFYYNYHDLTETLAERVVLIDPTDPDFTVTFNPLEKVRGISASEQTGQLISAFKKIWSSAWGVRMEDLMRNSLLGLSEAELTLVELPHFLTNRAFRMGILQKVENPIVHEYFKRFDSLTDRGQVTWIEPVMNKINALFSDERVRQMFSSNKSSFDLREIMDNEKILLIKLDKGKLHDLSDLLGSLIMARTQMAAFSRSDIPQDQRTPFYLYIDEFQNFATDTFSVVLSEARKYGLSLIMAHQTLSQIPSELRSLILGNTGIQVYFRLNRHDADLLAKEGFEYSGYEVKTVNNLRPIFWSYREEQEHKIGELQNLQPRTCYVKHKIEGGMIPLTTVDIEPARSLLKMGEHKYQNFLQGLPFGKRYLVARKKLASIEQERAKSFSEGLESVVQKRKRLGQASETAQKEEKESTREMGKTELGLPEQEGKDKSQHRFLQDLIKQAAEGAGYRAEIEKQTSDGLGRVDVHIERNGRMIACEVCVGSTGGKEAANIEKRLKAGYETIVLCSPDTRTLERARALVSERLKDPEKNKVLFFEPPELFSYLERLGLKAGAGAGIETDTDAKEKSLTLKSEKQLHEKPKLKLVIRDKQVFTGARRTIEDREVFLNGKSYRLTNKPFLFLYALARSRKLG